MMAKKPKEANDDNEKKKSLNGYDDSCSGSGSTNTFQSLFGDDEEQQSSVSVFSHDNPFRREPSDRSFCFQQPDQQQSVLGFGSGEGVGSTSSGEYENPNMVDVNNRKRKRNGAEQNSSLDFGAMDSDLEIALKIKKSKKEEPKGPDWSLSLRGSSKRGKGQEYTSGPESMEASETGKKKKKRKRDELEAELEAQFSGVLATKYEGGEEGLGGKVVGEKRKKIDDPVETLVPKEGFEDEGKLLRTVFVGNLSLKIKKKALFKEFSQFGEIESVTIRFIPLLDINKPRNGAIIQKKINDAVNSVHASIVFKTEQAAQASLAHNMGVVGGNHIRVDRACPPLKKLKGENVSLYDYKRTVFLDNLPFDVKDEEIYQLFSGINGLESSIEAIRVIRDSGTTVGKSSAHVLFKTRGAANLVVKRQSLKLREHVLTLRNARSKLTPKRKNPSLGERNGSPTKRLLMVDLRTPETQRDNKMETEPSCSYQKGEESGREKLRERKRKRPSEIAGKVNTLNSGGGVLKITDQRQNLENQTSERSCPNEKRMKLM
ncbi:hypothetical protein U1Q18_021551 [Sarracenia purpurea var. burkii]